MYWAKARHGKDVDDAKKDGVHCLVWLTIIWERERERERERESEREWLKDSTLMKVLGIKGVFWIERAVLECSSIVKVKYPM